MGECRSRLTGDGLERALEFHLVDTVMSGLAIGATFGNGLLARTATDAHAVNDESLFGAVALFVMVLKAYDEILRT